MSTFAESSVSRICLNMIVKNEAAILERCLRAVAPSIACYVIADTGSNDGTKDIIRNFFNTKGIPGEIVDIPFLHFEQARNGALEAARASTQSFDYILLCDADMELVVTSPPLGAGLRHAAYSLLQKTAGGLSYQNVRLVRRDAPGRYVGVTHEALIVDGETPVPRAGAHFIDHACGSNRATKYERDVRLLSEGLTAEPGNTRYMFYLANSYFDLGRFEDAIGWYRKRIEAAGWIEEVFYSAYRVAQCWRDLGREAEFFHEALLTYDRFPDRAEPLFVLANHCMSTRRYRLGYEFAARGAAIPLPPESALFVETDVYTWRLLDVQAVCSYYIGRKSEGALLNERLLAIAPESHRPRIEENLRFCRS